MILWIELEIEIEIEIQIEDEDEDDKFEKPNLKYHNQIPNEPSLREAKYERRGNLMNWNLRRSLIGGLSPRVSDKQNIFCFEATERSSLGVFYLIESYNRN